MKPLTLIQQYVWIADTIYRARRITFSELNERWKATEMSGGQPMVRMTFYRYKEDLQRLFGIIIDCDASDDYRYYIVNREEMRESSTQRWMLDTLRVNGLISESLSLHDRIQLETMSYDEDMLRLAIEAMKQNHRIIISYKCYDSQEIRQHPVEPYCIKLYRHRWYLLGRYESGKFAMFSLDRIRDIKITGDRFELDKKFDTEVFFQDYFGVIISNKEEIQRIVLRAYGWERKSMLHLPMHCSQRELQHGDGYIDYEITAHTTNDLTGYILSRGQWLVVKYPQWYADEIKQGHMDAVAKY